METVDSARLCVDTSLLIGYLREREPEATLMEIAIQTRHCCIASVTAYELLLGAERVGKTQRENDLLAVFTILPFDEICARYAAGLHAGLIRQNADIGIKDIFIAATCLTHRVSLLTSHYERTPFSPYISTDIGQSPGFDPTLSISMDKLLRACVIGLGNIGNLHADIYKADPLAELVGVCDKNPERAAKAGQRLGVPYFLDVNEMLAALKPDLCSVATGGFEYSSDHYEPTMQALAAGCHVLGEKPISNDIACAEEMVASARQRGLCYAIDLNHRFTPAARTAKQWQNEGRIGSLLFCNMALWIGRPEDLDSPYYHLKALNPHSVDIMRYFCGDVARVQCFATKAPGRWMWSTASINMQFANGAVGHLTSSYDLKRAHNVERCEVNGVNGRFVIEDMWVKATLFPSDSMIQQVYQNPVFGGFTGFPDTFRDRIHTFLQQLTDGVAPEHIDGAGVDGLAAQKVIHAAIESLDSGQVVELGD